MPTLAKSVPKVTGPGEGGWGHRQGLGALFGRAAYPLIKAKVVELRPLKPCEAVECSAHDLALSGRKRPKRPHEFKSLNGGYRLRSIGDRVPYPTGQREKCQLLVHRAHTSSADELSVRMRKSLHCATSGPVISGQE